MELQGSVIFKRKYSFTDKNSGEVIQGSSLMFLPDGAPVKKDDCEGVEPLKIALGLSQYPNVRIGKAKLDIGLSPRSSGGCTLSLLSITPIN